MKRIKRLLLVISVLSLVLLQVSCINVEGMIKTWVEDALETHTATYTIRVEAPVGMNSTSVSLNFTGEYGFLTGHYNPVRGVDIEWHTYEIEGDSFWEWTQEAIGVAGSFRKGSGCDGLLRVQIWKDWNLAYEAATTEPYGMAVVSWIG